MENTTEIDNTISGAEVKRIIEGVQSAQSMTKFSQTGYEFKMYFDPNGKKIIEQFRGHEAIVADDYIESQLKLRFNDLNKAYLNREEFPTGLFIFSDKNESGANMLYLVSNTSIGRLNDNRHSSLVFALDFGENLDKLQSFVEQTQENPLFLKSAMERIFSPDVDNPYDSKLRGRMDRVGGDISDPNIVRSPFIRLSEKTPVFISLKS